MWNSNLIWYKNVTCQQKNSLPTVHLSRLELVKWGQKEFVVSAVTTQQQLHKNDKKISQEATNADKLPVYVHVVHYSNTAL